MKKEPSTGALKMPSFDELKRLAETDPAEFDALKKRLCEQVIQTADTEMQPRLRAQQSHIDRVISQCKNPNHTNVVLMKELQKQVAKFRDALDNPSHYTNAAPQGSDTVVTFPNPKHPPRRP